MNGTLRTVTKNDKQRYTLGVVYEPNAVDTQGDFADAATIEKAAWDFMTMLQGKDNLTKTAVLVMGEIVKAAESGADVRLDMTDLFWEVEKRGLNDMHITGDNDEVLGTVVESYIAPVDFELGDQKVTKGTWMLGVQWSPEYFAKVEAGERTGFSMEGKAMRLEVETSA